MTAKKYLISIFFISILLPGCGLPGDPNEYAPDYFYLGEWTYAPTIFGRVGFMDIREDQFIQLLPAHDEVSGQYLGCYNKKIYAVDEFEPFTMRIRYEEDENNREEMFIKFLYGTAYITADVQLITVMNGVQEYDEQSGEIYRITSIPEGTVICGEEAGDGDGNEA